MTGRRSSASTPARMLERRTASLERVDAALDGRADPRPATGFIGRRAPTARYRQRGSGFRAPNWGPRDPIPGVRGGPEGPGSPAVRGRREPATPLAHARGVGLRRSRSPSRARSRARPSTPSPFTGAAPPRRKLARSTPRRGRSAAERTCRRPWRMNRRPERRDESARARPVRPKLVRNRRRRSPR